MKRSGPLKRDPQKTREWQERSRKKAAENARKKPRKPLKRKPIKKRKPNYKLGLTTGNKQAFRIAAEQQGCCAKCGRKPKDAWDLQTNFDAHHVIEKRYLKANYLPLFHGDNALLLCEGCHRGQTNRLRPLPLECLTDANIRYAFYLLKSYADTYLRRNYVGNDPRLERSLEELEAVKDGRKRTDED